MNKHKKVEVDTERFGTGRGRLDVHVGKARNHDADMVSRLIGSGEGLTLSELVARPGGADRIIKAFLAVEASREELAAPELTPMVPSRRHQLSY